VRILHTSDWHVGKSLRGLSRLEEQQAVLAEITSIAGENDVDLVLVVGDVFDSAAPSPEAQRLAWRTLLDLRATGAEVVVIAGNHDSPQVFDALRPVFAGAGISLLGRPVPAEQGGVQRLHLQGDELRLALVPFCSQRSIVKTAELLDEDAAGHAARYAERLQLVVGALEESFSEDAVNIVALHGFVRGARLGGGERDAQTIEDYWIDASAFGTRPHYVALGHLHLTQEMPGGCPIWYCGSPLQVDFGEEGDAKHVLLVDAKPGVPIAAPRKVRLSSPRRLRTVRGRFEELEAWKGEWGDDLLRVFVQEKARAGLARDVRELLPNAVDVVLDIPTEAGSIPSPSRHAQSRSAHELFADYLAERGVADDRLRRLFAELLDAELLDADLLDAELLDAELLDGGTELAEQTT
jgi:exonuclease SbcD